MSLASQLAHTLGALPALTAWNMPPGVWERVAARLQAAPTRAEILIVSQCQVLLLPLVGKDAGYLVPGGSPLVGERTLASAAARLGTRALQKTVQAHTLQTYLDIPAADTPNRLGITRVFLFPAGPGVGVPSGSLRWVPVAQTKLPPAYMRLLSTVAPSEPTSTGAASSGTASPEGTSPEEEGIEEDLSLGEPVPDRVQLCDIPPTVVLRTRPEHRALFRLAPLEAGSDPLLERDASRKQFPDARALEPLGFLVRGASWWAVTDDERAYPLSEEPDPADPLVVSLHPRTVRAFLPLLRGASPLPPQDMAYVKAVLDRLVRVPWEVNPPSPPSGVTQATRDQVHQALVALQANPEQQAAVADLGVWSWLCQKPTETQAVQAAWESWDYGQVLAALPRNAGTFGALVREAARQAGVEGTTGVAQVAHDVFRVGVPTSMLQDIQDNGTPAMRVQLAHFLAEFGSAQARQTILTLPPEEYREFQAILQKAIPRWEAFKGDKEDRKIRLAWVARAKGIAPGAPERVPPASQPASGGILPEFQAANVRGILQKIQSNPDFHGYKLAAIWQDTSTGPARTLARFTRESPPIGFTLVLPPQEGRPVVPIGNLQPSPGDVRLELPSSQGAPSVAPSSQVERLLARGARAGEHPGVHAFSSGYTSTPMGRSPDQTDPEWERALSQASGWVKRHALPGLSPILGSKGRTACGAFACAYQDKALPRLVVKFTGDVSDAAAWATVLARSGSPGARKALASPAAYPKGLEALAWTPVLFAVPGAQSPERSVVCIVQEFLVDLSPAEWDFFDQDAYPYRYLLETLAEDAAFWEGAATSYAQAAGIPVAPFQANVMRLRQTLATLKSYGIHLRDLRGANLRKNPKGAWKITDMGVSYGPEARLPEATPGQAQALLAALCP